MVKLKVALLTAGLGSQNFVQASERLISSSKKLYRFDSTFKLESQSLSLYCPRVTDLYGNYLNQFVPGYGFWIWKPEFIYRIAKGQFGKFDEIVWIDSGCEINVNYFSRLIFEYRINKAIETGHWLHALDNSENQYSKKSVKSQFSMLSDKSMAAPQIQANYMHLSIKEAMPLIRDWYRMSINSIRNFDFGVSSDEDEKFIAHRNDQSIFSLIAKKYGYTHARIDLPSGCSYRSVIRGLNEPVWIARNREGRSIIPNWIKLLP